ncbi:hypothetical protein [Donghicola mangrovi]|uniref:Uncharacterized protein n=1 Tax=Donghicola mangrovi TaxID=2729614 RepID=A0A850Q8A8_9RHOB|nr:hypothetical protein [Donghicola mangrovi]NVO24462.1 hypothetical protein [Donghicola mangrovi]
MDLPHIQFDSLFKMPWSGNIVQDIRPEFFSPSYSGKPEIEAKVITDVAGYGQQLGWISNALLELIDRAGLFEGEENDKIEKLRKLVTDVDEVKRHHKSDLTARAHSALDTLRIVDPDSYADLIARRTK